MRDFVVLADCSEEIRNAYSHAYGNKDHPSDFALERLRRARFSFGRIKEQFVAQTTSVSALSGCRRHGQRTS